MPIEKMITRGMVVCSIIFLILVAIYYPTQYLIIPITFVTTSFVMDMLMPSEKKPAEKKWERILTNIVVCIILFGFAGCMAAFMLIMKFGYFWRVQ